VCGSRSTTTAAFLREYWRRRGRKTLTPMHGVFRGAIGTMLTLYAFRSGARSSWRIAPGVRRPRFPGHAAPAVRCRAALRAPRARVVLEPRADVRAQPVLTLLADRISGRERGFDARSGGGGACQSRSMSGERVTSSQPPSRRAPARARIRPKPVLRSLGVQEEMTVPSLEQRDARHSAASGATGA
jgi:hypothetical protein